MHLGIIHLTEPGLTERGSDRWPANSAEKSEKAGTLSIALTRRRKEKHGAEVEFNKGMKSLSQSLLATVFMMRRKILVTPARSSSANCCTLIWSEQRKGKEPIVDVWRYELLLPSISIGDVLRPSKAWSGRMWQSHGLRWATHAAAKERSHQTFPDKSAERRLNYGRLKSDVHRLNLYLIYMHLLEYHGLWDT